MDRSSSGAGNAGVSSSSSSDDANTCKSGSRVNFVERVDNIGAFDCAQADTASIFATCRTAGTARDFKGVAALAPSKFLASTCAEQHTNCQ